MTLRIGKTVLGVLILTLIAGCDRSFEDMVEARTAYAEEGEGPIVVAVIDEPGRPDYLSGAQLALDEINAEGGGLPGRPFELIVYPGGTDFETLRPSIRRIAKDHRISAVLGHRTSSVAVPASVIYEAAEVLFLPSFATDPMLTAHDFRFVFRTLSDNEAMAEETAHLAALFGYKRVASLHARDDYSRELAFLFEDAAREQGIDIVFRGSFFAEDRNYRSMIGRLSGIDADAVYIATDTEAGARLLRQMREMGQYHPALVSDTVAAGDLSVLLDDFDDGVIAPMIYDPDNLSMRNRAFREAWRARHGAEPDKDAALGYDAMRLFAEITRRAGSTEPQVLAASAHYGPPVVGVDGFYAFDESGDVYGKTYGFRALRSGRWWALPGVEMPYLLARLETALAANQTYEPPPDSYDPVTDLGEEEAEEYDPEMEEIEPPELEEGIASSADEAEDVAEGFSLESLQQDLDRNQTWLALAHAVLGFERLGVVSLPGDRGAAATSLARSVAAARGFELEICDVSAAPEEASPEEAQAALTEGALECYSQLAPEIDALFSAPDAGLPQAELRRLNRGLRAFQVPAIGIGQAFDADYGLTLAVVGSNLGLDDPRRAQRFVGLLNGISIFDLSRTLAELPTIAVDFDVLEAIGRRLTPQQLSVISRALETGSVPPAKE